MVLPRDQQPSLLLLSLSLLASLPSSGHQNELVWLRRNPVFSLNFAALVAGPRLWWLICGVDRPGLLRRRGLTTEPRRRPFVLILKDLPFLEQCQADGESRRRSNCPCPHHARPPPPTHPRPRARRMAPCRHASTRSPPWPVGPSCGQGALCGRRQGVGTRICRAASHTRVPRRPLPGQPGAGVLPHATCPDGPVLLGVQVPPDPLLARPLVPFECGADSAWGPTSLLEWSGVWAPSCQGPRAVLRRQRAASGWPRLPRKAPSCPHQGLCQGLFLTNILHLGSGFVSIPSSLGRFLSQEQKFLLQNVLRLPRAPDSRRAPSVKHAGPPPAALLLGRTQRVTPSPAPCISLRCCLVRVSESVSSGGRLALQGMVRVSPPLPHERPGGLLLSPQFLGGFVGEVPQAPEPREDLGHLLVTSPPPACGLRS